MKRVKIYYLLCSMTTFLSTAGIAEETLPSENKNTIQFDKETLKTLGYGPEVADFFEQRSQFLPGQHDVTIIVNHHENYTAPIIIDGQGSVCFTSELIETLKLKAVETPSACPSLTALYPNATLTAYPNRYVIDIIVPESAFDPKRRGKALTQGGTALLTNYRVYGMQMKTTNEQQHFYQGQFDSGVNWDNWILRNNSSFSKGKNDTHYQFNETTLTRSINHWQSQLQLGQISSQGSLFGGTPLNGVQLYSDSALDDTGKLVVPITGVAETDATVEVSQNGRLLYRTMVSAGAFELDRISNVVSGQPLNVTVIQNNGHRQQFSVTTAPIKAESISTKQYQLGLGQYRKYNRYDETKTPFVGSVEGAIRHGATEYGVGGVFSSPYKAVGGRLNYEWLPLSLNTGMGGTYAYASDKRGTQLEFTVSGSVIERVSMGVSSVYQTRNYQTLYESLQRDQDRVWDETLQNHNLARMKTSNSASIGLTLPYSLGSVGYNLGYYNYYDGAKSNRYNTYSYRTRIKDVSASVTYQAGDRQDNRLYVVLSAPLSRRTTFSAQMQQYQNETTLSSRFNHRITDEVSYGLGVTNYSSDRTRFNGNLTAKTPYSQINASGSWRDENANSMMLSASGAIVYADGIVGTSPVAVGNTFGILRVPGQSGVKVSSMGGGGTITNHFGTAVIPSLPVNRKNTVKLNTKNLPLNVRLATTSFDVAVSPGTVISRNVPATVVKQLLLEIALPSGKRAPDGASLIDENGQLVGVVMGDGHAILSNEQIGKPIRLRQANQSDCLVQYTSPSHFDENNAYETVEALCQ